MLRYRDIELDYAQRYTAADLTAAVHAAEGTCVFGVAEFRAEAVRAWRRVAEMAKHMETTGTADAEAIALARGKAAEATERLRAARTMGDLPVADATRDYLAKLAAEADRVPDSVAAAIECGFVPASPDVENLRARFDADVCAMEPPRIACAPRKADATFTLNTEGGTK